MRPLYILCFFACTLSLAAEEDSFTPETYSVSTDKEEMRERQHYPITFASYAIEPKVDPVSGDYVEESLDFVIAGGHPLSLRRFYNSSAPHDPHYTMWRYNPEYFAAGNLGYYLMEKFAVVGNAMGGITYLKEMGGGHFGLSTTEACNHHFSGQGHPLNTKLSYKAIYPTKDTMLFLMRGEIIDGAGSVKKFSTKKHVWHNYNVYVKPHYFRPTVFHIYPTVWTPYHLMVEEERCPNGNIISYNYMNWRKEDDYPKFSLLSSITLYNRDKSRILATLHFWYKKGKKKRIEGIGVRASDGRSLFFEHQGKNMVHLTERHASFLPPVHYGYKDTKLTHVSNQSGVSLETSYYGDGRVYEQYAPIGKEGQRALFGRYAYHPGYTEAWDALLQKTIYHYDHHKRVTLKKYYVNEKPYKIEEMKWEENTGNLLRSSIKDGENKEHLFKEYKYDKNHNLIEERIGDHRGSQSTYRTFSNDGMNLLLSEKSPTGLLKKCSYVSGTNLCASEEYYEGSALKKRIRFFYDDAAVCIKKIEDEGEGGKYCKIELIQPKREMPCLGLPEFIEERSINEKGEEISLGKRVYRYTPFGGVEEFSYYDGEGNFIYSVENRYDAYERVIWTKDAMGSIKEFSYDIHGNLTDLYGPRKGMHKEIIYDRAKRPIKSIDGPLVTETEYDLLGRVVAEIDSSGFKKSFFYDRMGNLSKTLYADGKSSFREYNLLGHLIKEVDLDGYSTLYKRDFAGQPLEILYPDSSKESFVYDQGGRCITKYGKNGVRTEYVYDIFDNILTQKVYENKTLLKESSATYSAYTLLSSTDEMGITTTYEYDSIGRKIAEHTLGCVKLFFYDALGRLYKREEQGSIYLEEFDLSNNVIERRVEDERGRVLRKRNFSYDASGNLIATHMYKGSFVKEYNLQNQLIATIDPLGYKTTYTYEYHGGLKTSSTDPNGLTSITKGDCHGNIVESMTLNGAGEVIEKCERLFDGRGNKIEERWGRYSGSKLLDIVVNRFLYGPLNRLEEQMEAGKKVTHYYYDPYGRLSKVVTPKGSEHYFTYNALGYKSRFTGADFDYHYTYDKVGKVVEVVDAISKIATVKRYNELGNVIYEKLANGIELSNEYDLWGRRVRSTLPDGSSVSYTYYADRLYKVDRDMLSFYYSRRDLEGYITEVTFPEKLGLMKIERDALCRWRKMETPYFKEFIPEGAYDNVGNLLSVTFHDGASVWTMKYAYDSLNQLREENHSKYSFDSLGSCLERDGQPRTSNVLSQVLQDEKGRYSYDANGNLLSKGEFTFFYDTLDRLIVAEKKKLRIEYGYDDMHRRMWKSVNGKRVLFIWDGSDEIGAMEKGKIKELRLLGEGFEAEVGSSLLFELGEKSYLPIHDHRGNVVQIVDVKSRKVVGRSYYSAFGEHLVNKCSVEYPWHFCSKRLDPETGFTYFGRRYYMAEGERWLTADPAGFVDGPNLYAYVYNNPLTSFDPYGLWSNPFVKEGFPVDPFFGIAGKYVFQGIEYFAQNFMPRYGNGSILAPRDLVEAIGRWGSGHGKFWEEADYRKNYNRVYTYPGIDIKNVTVAHHNGMETSFDEAVAQVKAKSEAYGGVRVDLLYNGKQGLSSNGWMAILTKMGLCQSYDKMCKDYYSSKMSSNPDGVFDVSAHSQGGIYMGLLSKTLPKDLTARINLHTYGSGTLIKPGAFGGVVNYVSEMDGILFCSPHAYGKALFSESKHIHFLAPHSNNPFKEHSFLGETYHKQLSKDGDKFRDKYLK